MAKEKGKIEKGKSDTNEINTDAMDILYAATYGISPDFIKKNDKLLDETRRVLSDKLSPKNQNTSSVGSSNAGEYIKILNSVVTAGERIEMLSALKQNESNIAPSGSHSINEGVNIVDKLSDSTIVDELMGDIQNHFALMPEYSKVCDLIPELGKCVEIIVKDILNRDEFTHSFITNFYKENVDSDLKTEVETSIKELLVEYDFEGKIRKWIKDAEIMGVKPFSILPQDDVIHMVNREIAKRIGMGSTLESINADELIDTDSLLKKSPLDNIHKPYTDLKLGITEESSTDDYERMMSSIESTTDAFTKSIITSDIVDEWVDVCKEEFNDIYQLEKILKSNNVEEYDKMCKTVESFEQKMEDPVNLMDKQSCIKKQLNDLVVCFDRSIEVVDPMKTPVYQAAKKIKNNNYYNSDSDLNKGIIDNFYRVGDDNEITKDKKHSKMINIDGFDIDVGDDFVGDDKKKNKLKNKRAILTEYEPEHVIPLTSGGTHIGYYVVEFVRTSGDNFLLLKKDRGSFTDIVRRLGVGEDKALVANTGTASVDTANPYGTGAFSPTAILKPMMGGGFSGSLTPYGGLRQEGVAGISNRKTELIKTILIKTIAKRLGDDTLVDDGAFQSALMNLIRDDIIFRNNVRFTYIPESHMVYMSRELDSAGYPLSVFDGTLFNCYIYIASLVSSLMMKVMKSSDTEVMEVNVGKSKELGLTIGSISQNASTRNVSARSLFGGTDNIVRSVGNFKRIIIPVINGEKLYDVTQVENVNNVDIDDDFTERNLKAIIMKIGVPPTSLDMLSQDEYVASQTQHRLDYRTLIVDRGVNYSKFITKAIKLLVNYSDLFNANMSKSKNDETNNEKTNALEVSIDKIKFSFAVPKNLTVSRITEELSSIVSLVDDIFKMYYGEETREGPEWAILMKITKKNLMKSLSSSTDWSAIDKIIIDSLTEVPAEYQEMLKLDKQPANNSDNGGGDGEDNTGGEFGGGGF